MNRRTMLKTLAAMPVISAIPTTKEPPKTGLLVSG